MVSKIMVVDKRKSVLDALYTRIMVDDEMFYQIDLDTATSTIGLDSKIAMEDYDYVLISGECILENNYVVNDACPMYGFAASKEDVSAFHTIQIPFVGICRDTNDIFDIISNDISTKVISRRKPAPVVPNTPVARPMSEPQPPKPDTSNVPSGASSVVRTEDEILNELHSRPEQQAVTSETRMVSEDILPNAALSDIRYINDNEEDDEDISAAGNSGADDSTDADGAFFTNAEKKIDIPDSPKMKNTSTTTLSVYSPKGGVGKTTISSEIATMLALTNRGRGKPRVCLVDYNVDFGDVTAKFGMEKLSKERRRTMYPWAMQIQSRMQNGEDAASIQYSRDEIEQFLQKATANTANNIFAGLSAEAELYMLLAPDSHSKSWDIEDTEYEIMLDQIIKNGGFDFVICDTGNSTRDSTIIALRHSDMVLFLTTQDKSAVNDCARFRDCMEQIARDTGVRILDNAKVYMAINFATDASVKGISIQEVESFLRYDCIAVYVDDKQITYCNNISMPMVISNPNSAFSKAVESIVKKLVDEPFEIVTKKKGFFQRLFKR